MPSGRMVPLVTVPNAFHARVIAARLGAEGIVTHLRGGVDGPYPVGNVDVLVDADALDAARELLMADEVESAFAGGAGDHSTDVGPHPIWLVLVAMLLATAVVAARFVG